MPARLPLRAAAAILHKGGEGVPFTREGVSFTREGVSFTREGMSFTREGMSFTRDALPQVRSLQPIEEAGILEGRNGIKETF